MSEFWRGKKVLVTGHTGFKGGWLSLLLSHLGAHVTGYGLVSDGKNSFFAAAGIASEVDSKIGDIRNLEHLKSVVLEVQPEFVFHLAAQPLVRNSYKDPLNTYSTNIIGVVNLLESLRLVTSLRGVVNVTTDKCYENVETIWPYREDDKLGGFDPYSSSKACAEIVTESYRRSFFFQSSMRGGTPVGIATARAGNVIGGGDWSVDRLVPDAVRSCIAKEPINIRIPDAIRPWQYVLEPLRGYLMLAERLCESPDKFSGAWNFGPNDDSIVSVETVVNSLMAKLGGDVNLDRGEHPHEANLLSLDCTKAKSVLGWYPIVGIHNAVESTVGWYQEYLSGNNMKEYSLNEINSYLNKQGNLSEQRRV